MCGSSNDNYQQVPSPPPVERWKDVEDEITGVKAIRVKEGGWRGREVIKIIRNRSPFEKELFETAQTVFKDSFNKLNELYSADPRAALDYAPYIQKLEDLSNQRSGLLEELTNLPDVSAEIAAYKERNKALADEMYSQQANRIREQYSSMGYSPNSYVVQEQIRALDYERAKTERDIDDNAGRYARDIAAQDLNLATARIQNKDALIDKQQVDNLQKLNLQQAQKADLEKTDAQKVRSQEQIANLAGNYLQYDHSKAANSVAPQLGLQYTNALNGAQNQQYAAQVQGVSANNQAIANSQGPSLLTTGAQLVGAGIGAYASSGKNPFAFLSGGK